MTKRKIEYAPIACFSCYKMMQAPLDYKRIPWCRKCMKDCMDANMRTGDQIIGNNIHHNCRRCGKPWKSSKRRFMGTQWCTSCERKWFKEYKHRKEMAGVV